jgi:biopolymer transport protein ExbB/TolQ
MKTWQVILTSAISSLIVVAVLFFWGKVIKLLKILIKRIETRIHNRMENFKNHIEKKKRLKNGLEIIEDINEIDEKVKKGSKLNKDEQKVYDYYESRKKLTPEDWEKKITITIQKVEPVMDKNKKLS